MSELKNENIIQFFNNKASDWDNINIDAKPGAQRATDMFASKINNAIILDIGCATGILEPFLIANNAKEIDGVDISDKMINIAKDKFVPYKNITFYCNDITNFNTQKIYDLVFMYNVYPHFSDKKSLVSSIDKLTHKNSEVAIVHGSSKEEINSHHKSHACAVSTKLASAEAEAEIWKDKFDVVDLIDNDSFYMIHLKKKHWSI